MTSTAVFLRLKNIIKNEFFYRRKSAICEYSGLLITVKYILVSICEENKIQIDIEGYTLDKVREEFYNKNKMKYMMSDWYDYEPYIKSLQLIRQINDLVDIIITKNVNCTESVNSRLNTVITSVETMQNNEKTIRYF